MTSSFTLFFLVVITTLFINSDCVSFSLIDVSSYVDYSSSEEEEKYVRPKTAKRGKNRDDTDSGSDVRTVIRNVCN